MHVDLSNKVAIVTGSGQGIGEGIARAFAKAGAKVVIATRSKGNGQAVADSIVSGGGVAWLNQTDVGRRTEVKRVVAETVERFGRLDIVVHNAAVYPVIAIEQLSDEDLDLTLSVNLKAGFWFIQESLPHLRKQGGGRLLFTSSVTGPNVAMPGTAHYAASKCRPQRPDPHGRARVCAPKHHGERGRAGLHSRPGHECAGRTGGAR